MKPIAISIGSLLRLKQRWFNREQYKQRLWDMRAFEAIMHPERLKGADTEPWDGEILPGTVLTTPEEMGISRERVDAMFQDMDMSKMFDGIDMSAWDLGCFKGWPGCKQCGHSLDPKTKVGSYCNSRCRVNYTYLNCRKTTYSMKGVLK